MFLVFLKTAKSIKEKATKVKDTAKEFREKLRSQKKGKEAHEKGSFEIGDTIDGVKVVNVKPGTNGKVAVIGRSMKGHVEKVAAK
ncbi:MAG: hypothetical protein JKY08_10845 [Flavobacteriaceae bacterium]|nr:hypothetical protein [Flavobacteriaceae bacterium]